MTQKKGRNAQDKPVIRGTHFQEKISQDRKDKSGCQDQKHAVVCRRYQVYQYANDSAGKSGASSQKQIVLLKQDTVEQGGYR
jgi:hypothetical protein